MLGEAEVSVLRAEISNISRQLEKIEAALTKQREETREDINRIHERLDAQRDAVARKECEGYREKCGSRQESRNAKQDDKITSVLMTLAKWGGFGAGISAVMKFIGN